MNTISKVAIFVALAFSMLFTPAAAQLKPYVKVDAAAMSLYTWRGTRVVDDPVFQPSVTLGYGGLSFNLWGNLDIGDVNSRSGQFTELDYTIDYSCSAGIANFSLGMITYDFPTYEAEHTTELYFGLGLAIPANPSITFYRDVDEVKGTYISLGAGHSIPVEAWKTSLDLAANFGIGGASYNDVYHGSNDSALTDFLFSASMPFAIGPCLTITPSVSYNGIVNGDIRDLYDMASKETDHFVVGITLSSSF